MRSIPNVVVFMVVISLAAYALHEFVGDQPPPSPKSTMVAPRLSAADVAPAATVKAAAAGPVNDGLVYPTPATEHALHLGYALFTKNADGSMMALPLPPHTAWHTMLALPAAGHLRLVVSPTDAKCAFGVSVAVYRPDRADPVWHADLAAHGASAKQVLDLSKINGPDPLLVSLNLADGAQNNWSCNVALNWEDKP